MQGIMIESSGGDNRQPRIALVTTELAVGGAEQCLTRLAIGLAQRGFQPAVYSLLPPPAAPRDRLVRQLADAAVPVQFLGLRRATQFRRGVRTLAELLTRQPPALIQSFLFHANILATFATRRLRHATPLVTGWRVADQRPCRAWLETRLTRHVDHVVCVSQAVADQALRLGIPAARLSVIPNGVDTTRFAAEPLTPVPVGEPAPSSTSTAAIPEPLATPLATLPATLPATPLATLLATPLATLLAIGRLDPQKGFDWLLQGAPRLLTTLPGYRLEIVGEGPERAVLAARIAAAGLQGRVQLTGWQDDIPRRLRSAALVLVPSRWEGMPNVVLEAMAAGRAVVATQVEGVRELLGPECSAQSTPVHDLAAFVDRVIELARDPVERTRLGEANARRARERFSIDAMVDAYAALYRTLCS
jgi:glycosyltransferase involved in cell wall biosynthesis